MSILAMAAIIAAWPVAFGSAPARAAETPPCGGPIQIAPPPSKRPPPIQIGLADGRSCQFQCPSPDEPSGPPGEIVIADGAMTRADGALLSTRLTYDAALRVYAFRQSLTKPHQPTREIGTRIDCQAAAGR